MLHFTRHYIDILQEMLLSLMIFCGKFIKVYVCQKSLKYILVWRNYGKNKTVQFFVPQCTTHNATLISRRQLLTSKFYWLACHLWFWQCFSIQLLQYMSFEIDPIMYTKSNRKSVAASSFVQFPSYFCFRFGLWRPLERRFRHFYGIFTYKSSIRPFRSV